MEFEPFRKIARWSRNIVVSEKLDGTNGQIAIDDEGNVKAGSRNRWITPEADNYGFARWVAEHQGELLPLGPGRHFGEWWGFGIQRGYGLKEKRFSLFDAKRWAENESKPDCCGVVPVLYDGPLDDAQINGTLLRLQVHGSAAAPGFMNPEGIVIYHFAAREMFKKTIEKDQFHKGEIAA